MTTDEKRKELEATGYEFNIHTDGIVSSWTVELPDGTVLIKRFFFSDFDRANVESVVVRDAYEHLQRDTKLKALEDYIKRLLLTLYSTTPDMQGQAQVYAYVNRAIELDNIFNITADDESDSDG